MDTISSISQEKSMQDVFQAQQMRAPYLAKTTHKERIEKLKRIEHYLADEKRVAALAEAMYRDFKKPRTEVELTEIWVVKQQIRHIKKNLKRWMRPKSVSTPLAMLGTRSYIQYESKGVSLIIAPWNYPFNLAFVPLVYAIAAGNAITLKPSEMTPHTSAFMHKMITELFPYDEIAVFEGDAEVAQGLLDLPFNHVFFTGSPKIGKIVMGAAAKHLASVTLELGGKSPAIVDETANINATAAKTVWAKCLNNGQTCIAPDYLLLHESIADDFIAAYREKVNEYYNQDGKGVQASPDYSRIVNERHYNRIKGLLDDALEKGAEIAVGGTYDPADCFLAPTLLTNVTEEMEVMQEEIFGPIMPVMTYRKREELTEIINKRPKPLTLYINTKSKQLREYILANTSAGGTLINEYMLGYSNPNLPFGGVNNSGIGKSLGHHGFIEFSNERGVIRRTFGTLSMAYPPYTDSVKRLVKTLTKWL